jgi:hypothetical protein
MRSDLPPQLFDQLLAAASEKVRAKFQAEREFVAPDIDTVVGEVAGRIQASVATQPLSYAAAQVLVESLHRAGQLTTGKQQEFAVVGRFEETVAALSVMSNVPTAVNTQHHDVGGETVPPFDVGGRSVHACVSPPAPVDRAASPRFSPQSGRSARSH